jgi:hypothetical protein
MVFFEGPDGGPYSVTSVDAIIRRSATKDGNQKESQRTHVTSLFGHSFA